MQNALILAQVLHKMLQEGRSFLLFCSWPPEGSSAALPSISWIFLSETNGEIKGNRTPGVVVSRGTGAHLAVELGLLLQTKVLGGVGHYGEGGFWIVPAWKEENRGSAWFPGNCPRRLSPVLGPKRLVENVFLSSPMLKFRLHLRLKKEQKTNNSCISLCAVSAASTDSFVYLCF